MGMVRGAVLAGVVSACLGACGGGGGSEECPEGHVLGPGGCTESWPDASIDADQPDAFIDYSDCNVSPLCPLPSNPANVSVCGTLYDVETFDRIGAADGTLQVTFYDPLYFAANPDTAPPIGSATIDSCGRYTGIDVTLPSNGLMAIGTDDLATTGDDLYVRTGIVQGLSPGQRMNGVRAFGTRRTTDQAWTTSAGNPAELGGQTFTQRGVMLMVFFDLDAPQAEWTSPYPARLAAGVTPSGGDINAARDFMFSNAPPGFATIDTSMTSTGASGGALIIDAPTMASYSGTGGEPAGCAWQSVVGKSLPDLVFVAERIAVCD